MDIKALSITELKQLLSRVNQDLASIKRANKRAAIKRDIMDNEYTVANTIAKSFTNKQYPAPIQNKRIIADIAIQRDILDYLNNGGHIITRKSRKKIKPLSVVSYHKVSL